METNYSKSEVGHVKNVANLNQLTDACESFGAVYNPLVEIITIADLRAKHTECDGLIGSVFQKRGNYDFIVNDRQEAYDKLKPLTTRVYNSAAVITNDQRILDDLKRFIDKIRGTPATPQTNDTEEGQETKETRSNSQQSFDNRASHFRGFIEYLEQIPGYDPNETDLKIPALKSFLEILISLNEQVSKAHKALQKEMRDRDRAFYNEEEGLYMRTRLVKKYVKSALGANSAEYKQVRAIEFKDQKVD